MDVWVQNSQNWLNGKYGNDSRYLSTPTTGLTGWATMYSLTRALQIELGIANASNTFGPATLTQLTNQFGNVSPLTSNSNLIGILQCALWCKGYWGGTEFGSFGSSVEASVSAVRSNLGLTAGTSVSPKTFKSLLTMDAYTVIGSGTESVRAIQQWMNARYVGRSAFYLVPCDGIFSRDVQRGLMLSIQYEIGMSDGVANGNFGPGTMQGLRDQGNVGLGSVDSSKRFVRLFQAALTFNQYPTAFSGTFSASTQSVVNSFQAFAALPVSGRADFATWASLLVSTGDTTRQGRAVDCITTITQPRAQTLLAHGYQMVGRYLTNYPGPNPLDKKIKPGELNTILANGLSVFPIFQEGGDGFDYFSDSQGYAAGRAAHAAATEYGFKPGTVIYFAVDFDALQDEVWAVVVPHFQGINRAFAQIPSPFQVGIYGARNTCSIVSGQGLAALSFVSGMSTGYSGNLGFPLPANWAFDQILEYSIGSGVGAIAIDKDIVSGRDLGQNSLAPSVTLLSYVSWLASEAVAYGTGQTAPPNELVLHFLRHEKYDDLTWDVGAGPVDDAFVARINAMNVARVRGLISPGNSRYISADHLAASLNGLLRHGRWASNSNPAVSIGDMTGWAGDLAQVMADFVNEKRANPSAAIDAYTFGRSYIARISGESGYSASDFDEDIDALLIFDKLDTSTNSLQVDAAFAAYYEATSGECLLRYSRFLEVRFDADWSIAASVAADTFLSLNGGVIAFREGIWAANLNGFPFIGSGEVSSQEMLALVQAWLDVLAQKISDE